MFRWLLIYVFALVSAINPALAALTVTHLTGFNPQAVVAAAPQAFPVIAGSATTSIVATSTTTPHSLNMPSSISSGDMLLMFLQYRRGNRLVSSFSESWTQATAYNAGTGSTLQMYVFWRIADGTEGATTSVAITGGSDKVASLIFRITGAQSVAAAASTVTGTNPTPPDPPSLSPSWGSAKTLWFMYIGTYDATMSISAYPTNYSTSQTTVAANAGDTLGQRFWVAAYSNQTGTENPGTATLTGSQGWISQTIGVRPN